MKTFAQRFAGCGFLLIIVYSSTWANSPAYQQRRADYINTALANFSNDAITLQAYQGVPVDSTALNNLLNGIASGVTSDFDIVKLIRVLFFTNSTYDSQILPVLNAVPFWITKGDTIRNYWSENHMMMWMSSDWLLHERYGKAVDSTLDARLRHYLHLKVQYGFYEFFSSVYAPYCLSGLLNLADFSQDVEIKSLATQAAQRLLRDLLMLTNDQGAFFPTAGRNYYGKYESAYGQNHNNLIYLLTGFGPPPAGASHAGGFLASSSIPVDSVISSWTPEVDTLYTIGHSLDSGFVINSSMSHLDRIIFQWSSGAYFHPEVARESSQLLSDSALWNQVDFAQVRLFSLTNPADVPALANNLSCMSKSSVICGEEAVIFKHHSITLSSVQDFWKGKVGFQQFPCVANVGTTAVFTASGEIKSDWDTRNDNNENEHLPYVKQKSNVALVMYREEPKPPLLPFHHPEVALHWKDADFDETIDDSLWLFGKQGNGYVAVRRSCLGEINSVRACDNPEGQTWVIMVGDSGMYGSFSNFKSIIDNSQFEERWYIDTPALQSVYYAKIVVDTTSIEYAWRVDTTLTTGIESIKDNSSFHIFPNPAKDEVTLDLSSFKNQDVAIKVVNVMGQEVWSKKVYKLPFNQISLNTTSWQEGVYLVAIENQHKRFILKFIKAE